MLAVGLLLFCAPMFLHPDGFLSGDAYRDNDWLTDRLFDLLARRALLEEGVFPLRSPLVGGGFPTLGHPFDGSWAPTLLPVLLLGPVWGVKVNLIMLLGVGTWGVWRLARDVLQLAPPLAAFAAAAFGFSGWLPGMMLVGFYPQAMSMYVPGALALLLAPRTVGDRVLAGVLLFLLFQQGGNGFVAAVGFVGVALWVWAARERGMLLALGAPLLVTSGLALARRYEQPAWAALGAGLAVILLAQRPGRDLLPRARSALLPLAGALLVAGTLGVGKLAALVPLLADGAYAHQDNEPPSLWPEGSGPGVQLQEGERDEQFYNSAVELLEGLLFRAPAKGEYRDADPVPGVLLVEEIDLRFASREYQWIGLTLGVLLLAAVGVLHPLALPWIVLAGGAAVLCLGSHLWPDLHFLLTSGLPGVSDLRQPLKYYNFYLLLPLTLLAGLGAELLVQRWPRAAPALLGLALLWPFLQNAPIWADRFAEPLPPWSCPGCRSVEQVGHPSWVGLPLDEIERRGREVSLRERRRPPNAREYDNALRGVRTIDWYGTLERPEPTFPSHFVLPDGQVLPNPADRGDAWVLGPGTVRSLALRTNRVDLEVDLPAPARVVVNQVWLPGFVSELGAVAEEGGLLAVDLPGGAHRLSLRYRPLGQLLGLGASLGFALLWGAALWRWRREPAS